MNSCDIPTVALSKNCNVRVSKVALGTASLGDVYGQLTFDDKRDLIHTAFKAGITTFESSAFYGAGTAETNLGNCIRDLPRSEMVISTKTGK